MDTQDLMLGDWVQGYLPDTSLKVVGIPSEYRLAVVTSDRTYMELSIDDCQPIPITPEILEKNGFVYSDLPFEQSWQQFGLSLYRGGDGYRINCGENVAMIIDYVHQLQHALRLCGIEKEIVI